MIRVTITCPCGLIAWSQDRPSTLGEAVVGVGFYTEGVEIGGIPVSKSIACGCGRDVVTIGDGVSVAGAVTAKLLDEPLVMTFSELRDALDAQHACSDGSRFRDEALLKKVKGFLRSMTEDERRCVLARVVSDLFLNERKLRVGYGLEDVEEFIDWLDGERMWR